MGSRLLFMALWLGLLALLPPVESTAQASKPPHYKVIDLGALGGTYSYGYGINNTSVVSGGAATPTQTGGISQTAFLWDKDLHMVNLGTLGGADCPDCNSEALGPYLNGVAVISETAETDPNGEDFCAFGTHRQCLAAIWKNSAMTALPNLKGGSNGQASWTNHRGQTVGFAENGFEDTTCSAATPSQVLHFEAVIWEPDGKVRELRPLPGDNVGYAFGINNHGQAVGVTGLCSDTHVPPINPGSDAPHGVLWEKDGTPVYLGSLGGGAFTVPGAINDLGMVAGASLSSKDGTVHPFLWTHEKGMQDLGTFPGAIVTGIVCCGTLNNKGDAVGVTVDGTTFNMRAILWHDNELWDLNTLIPPNSGWSLQSASSINDAGQIAGWGTINGNTHAFLATPCDRDETDFSSNNISAEQGTVDTSGVEPKESLRELLQAPLGFGRPGAVEGYR